MSQATLKPLLIPVLCLAVLAGCSGSNDGDGRVVGHFALAERDAPESGGIENLSFETASTSGTTGEDGVFTFLPGETISFSIGNLEIAGDVPAAPFLTPLEIRTDQRELLFAGATDDRGLQTHRLIEEQLVRNSDVAINTMRLILVLNDEVEVEPSDTIRITERTIEQINAYLAEQGPEFDFGQPVSSFASPANSEFDNEGNLIDASPVNRMLNSICFAPEGDELCEEPPTLDEIENTADEEVQEELEDRRDQILTARRSLSDLDVGRVRDFLLAETRRFRLDLEEPYFLSPEALTLSPDETGIQTVDIRRAGEGDAVLQPNAIDARALSNKLLVQAAGWQSAEVDYFHTGENGDSGTILINFRIDFPEFDNYRWFRKTLRVCIQDDGSPCST